MIARVEVGIPAPGHDSLGDQVKKRIVEDLGVAVDWVRVVDVYLIEGKLTGEQIELLASDLLADPITQRFAINETLVTGFDQAIEVSLRPGVTDNVGATVAEAIEDVVGVSGASVYTAKLYLLGGAVSPRAADNICLGLLANPLINDYRVGGRDTWTAALDIHPGGSAHQPTVKRIDLEVDDDRLLAISREGLLSLSLEEMQAIRAYFRRPEVAGARRELSLDAAPTDVELEMLAQTWSEHCKHKVFNARIRYEGPVGDGGDGGSHIIDGVFPSYIRRATERVADSRDWLVSVFTDNAGIIGFNDSHNIVFKVETHNHPSALDPYGGALTGIVGVNRDPMGTGVGADLIFNTDVFCFGPPDYPADKLPPGVLTPKRIFKGVRLGVEHGGNKIGIPTVNGAILFDEAYAFNPLVFCGTGGIMAREIAGRPSHVKEIQPGDAIVMVGGRIGKDGIHGATFSSIKLDETVPPAVVQIGAPIVQKKMMDVLADARDRGLYRTITDNGAGGLSSSVGELAELSGGAHVELEKAPTKYPGLDPWELWVSESQERMTLAVPPENLEAFLDLCRRRDVDAAAIGTFTDSGYLRVDYLGEPVAHLEMEFLHKGLPRLELEARWPGPRPSEEPESGGEATPLDFPGTIKRILGSLNVCSKEWVIRQYDHEVQGTSVIKPLVGPDGSGPSDAAVIKPLADAPQGVAVACGINPKFAADPYRMAGSAVDEAVRNAVAVGADPDHLALLDNFCWGNPIKSADNPDGDVKLGALVRAGQACCDAAVALGAPFISGKDSLHNEYQTDDRTIAIPPTLLISAMAVVPDCDRAVTMDAKRAGDLVYVAGVTYPELGGSHYGELAGLGGEVPAVRLETARRLYGAVHAAIMRRLVASCHDCSEGGLAVALAETAFAGGLGVEIDLGDVPRDGVDADEVLLFSESNSRFVITVPADKAGEFEQAMAGTACARVGRVGEGDQLLIRGLHGATYAGDLDELKHAWQEPLDWGPHGG